MSWLSEWSGESRSIPAAALVFDSRVSRDIGVSQFDMNTDGFQALDPIL